MIFKAIFNNFFLVTPGNPERCDSMIVKRSIQLWLCFTLRVLVLVIIFLVRFGKR